MQGVHELGHVLHAWISRGTVRTVVLSPVEISRTDVEPNPHPQFVAWGGPIWGSLWPLLLWWAVHTLGWRRAWWLRFFAGFCLIANGAYLLGGSFFPAGDAETLLRHGAPRGSLIAFGIVSSAVGLVLWNRQGKHFGLGRAPSPIDRRDVLGVTAALLGLVAVELLLF